MRLKRLGNRFRRAMMAKFDNRFLNDVVVTTTAGKPVLLSDLWKEKTVVLKVLPRLGCCLCKYEARSLDELRMLCDPKEVALAAVCHTDPDLSTFLADGYWQWDIFLDPEREVYRKAQLFRVSKWQLLKDLMGRRIWNMGKFIEKKFGFENTRRGDPYQLGGTFVIEKGGRVLFQFRPSKLAMYPSIKEIYGCLGGDPDDIEEPTPERHVYSQEFSRSIYETRSRSSRSSNASSRSSSTFIYTY